MSSRRAAAKKVAFFDDPITYVTSNGEQFVKNSAMLLKRCAKPDMKEFKKLAVYTAGGFFLLGIVGYLVRAISIPLKSSLIP